MSLSVLGGGSWGTALAIALANAGHAPRLWVRNAAQAKQMAEERCNRRFLPDVPLPPSLEVKTVLGEVLGDARDVLVVVPSHAFREVLSEAARIRPEGLRIAWATKGLEPGTGRFLSDVVTELLPACPQAILSGPNFAAEVARGLPAASTLASRDDAFAQELLRQLHAENFRVYTSRDMVGVQVGGAVKNVLALAAGICDGLGFGANARAALIARGLSEMMRFGAAVGAKRETLMGLAGLGDLVLTCTDDQSRNRRAGLVLGKGGTVEDAQQRIGQVIEGISTTTEVMRVAQKLGVEMPITEQVWRLLHGEVTASEAVVTLLRRAPSVEA